MAEHQIIDRIRLIITEFLTHMGVQARVEYEDSLSDGLIFTIYTRDAKLLIGHQGATLHALEHILHSIAARKFADRGMERVYFSIDVDGYKRNRMIQIKQLIKKAVLELKRSQSEYVLPAMSNYERRFVHNYISEQFPHVSTQSVGRDPNRSVKLSM